MYSKQAVKHHIKKTARAEKIRRDKKKTLRRLRNEYYLRRKTRREEAMQMIGSIL